MIEIFPEFISIVRAKMESKIKYLQKRQFEAFNTIKSIKAQYLDPNILSQRQASKSPMSRDQLKPYQRQVIKSARPQDNKDSLDQLKEKNLKCQNFDLTTQSELLSKHDKKSSDELRKLFLKVNSERLFHIPTQIIAFSPRDKSISPFINSHRSQKHNLLESPNNFFQTQNDTIPHQTENSEMHLDILSYNSLDVNDKRPQSRYFNSHRKADLPDASMKNGIQEMLDAKIKLMDYHDSELFNIKHKFFNIPERKVSPLPVISYAQNNQSPILNISKSLQQLKSLGNLNNYSFNGLKLYELDDLLLTSKESTEENVIKEKKSEKYSPKVIGPLFKKNDFSNTLNEIISISPTSDRQVISSLGIQPSMVKKKEVDKSFLSFRSLNKTNLTAKGDDIDIHLYKEKCKSSRAPIDKKKTKMLDSRAKSPELLSLRSSAMISGSRNAIDLELVPPFSKKRLNVSLRLNSIKRLETIVGKNSKLVELSRRITMCEEEDSLLSGKSTKNIIPSKNNLFRLEPSKNVLKRLFFTKKIES